VTDSLENTFSLGFLSFSNPSTSDWKTSGCHICNTGGRVRECTVGVQDVIIKRPGCIKFYSFH
jgi:hypothetical protein